MRKIVASEFISLDGVVEAPEAWHFPYVEEEMLAAVQQVYRTADTLLLGRATYDIFAASWPNRDGDLADAINGLRKLVISKTLQTAEWNHATIIRGDLATTLTKIKQEPGRDIAVAGSITLTRSLLAAGLLDELHLLVHPIILGSGRRLFDDLDEVPLTLTASTVLKTGVLDLRYQPTKGNSHE
ncbi:dihydrofolate reductase family protein [Nonomuraea sp. NPDC050663]|uniref:dihydrofolate reductase family protein n=1 Tax=Nonomuraea sp. NPDC050663 TaxID=3364370 RepID=UPI003792C300